MLSGDSDNCRLSQRMRDLVTIIRPGTTLREEIGVRDLSANVFVRKLALPPERIIDILNSYRL